MSDYLNSADSGSDDENPGKNEYSEAEIQLKREESAQFKAVGNDHFSKAEYAEALDMYSKSLLALNEVGLPKDAVILLNRSATYLALKRYVPALNDANQGKSF
jgi:tetratricopeptide (TPR) repeat protein